LEHNLRLVQLAKILFFRPNFDTSTLYGHAWLGESLKLALNLGHEVVDLEGENATETRFFEEMGSFQPDFVAAVGHGSASVFSGQDAETVLQACTNDQVMAGKEAYFLSCLMGQRLIPSMISKGAYTVAGYTTEFTWSIDDRYLNRPLEDPRAYPFMAAFMEGLRVLLEGGTWSRFYDATVNMFNAGIAEWTLSTDLEAVDVVAGLKQDRNSLIVLGEGQVSPQVFVDPVSIPSLALPVALFLLTIVL